MYSAITSTNGSTLSTAASPPVRRFEDRSTGPSFSVNAGQGY
jgi:hypothetical protein